MTKEFTFELQFELIKCCICSLISVIFVDADINIFRPKEIHQAQDCSTPVSIDELALGIIESCGNEHTLVVDITTTRVQGSQASSS